MTDELYERNFVTEVLLHEDSSDGEKVKKKSGRGRPVRKVNYSEVDDKGKKKKKRGRKKLAVSRSDSVDDGKQKASLAFITQ